MQILFGAILLFAIIFFAFVIHAWRTGTVRVRNVGTFTRKDNPGAFYLAIVWLTVAGLAFFAYLAFALYRSWF